MFSYPVLSSLNLSTPDLMPYNTKHDITLGYAVMLRKTLLEMSVIWMYFYNYFWQNSLQTVLCENIKWWICSIFLQCHVGIKYMYKHIHEGQAEKLVGFFFICRTMLCMRAGQSSKHRATETQRLPFHSVYTLFYADPALRAQVDSPTWVKICLNAITSLNIKLSSLYISTSALIRLGFDAKRALMHPWFYYIMLIAAWTEYVWNSFRSFSHRTLWILCASEKHDNFPR